MPITVTTPAPGQVLGPGYQVSAYSDFIGPLPTGSYWDFDLVKTTGEWQLSHARQYTQDTNASTVMGQSTGGATPSWLFNVLTPTVKPGDTARLVVKLVQAPSTILDQTTVDVVWEPTAGAPWVLQEQISHIATGTGGFTASDRTVASKTLELATFNLGGFLPGLPGALADALPVPYGSELITPDRTGAGVLTRPGGIFNVNALGIRFQVISRPAGIGVDEGAPPSFDIPLLELGLTRQMRGNEIVNEDSHWFTDANGEWIWNFNAPHEVLYWIVPGVTVRFWWVLLQLTQGQLLGPSELQQPPS